jgi:hypothetical protein
MTSFIESAPIDIGDGDKYVFLTEVIPDITFNGSTSATQMLILLLKLRTFLEVIFYKHNLVPHKEQQLAL